MSAKRTVLGCLAALFFGSPAHAQLRDTTLSVSVHGIARVAFVHAPADASTQTKLPLVFGFHGGAGNAEGYIENSRLFEKAGRAGYLAICPQGTAIFALGRHRVWNSGPEYAHASRNADDVLFTKLMIDKASSLYSVDSKRVFVTGFSNGGQMAYRLALQLSDRIAAIAPMSGGRLAGSSRPSRPVPVLHIHGTADSYYPFEGGLGANSLGRTPHAAIEDVIREWTGFNGAAQVRSVLHSGWQEKIFDGPAPVELVLVEGMGHQIAGGTDDRLPDQPMRDMPDAIDLALAFFSAHPMR